MCQEVLPEFEGGVSFPEPYDMQHPHLNPVLKASGKCLVTRRMLTMDLSSGKSVTKIGKVRVRVILASESTSERKRDRAWMRHHM